MSDAKSLAAELAADHPKTDVGMVENNARKAAAEGSAPAQSTPPPASETKTADDVIRDKAGEIFNPKKHQTNQWGRPDFTDGGYFKRRKAADALKEYFGRKASQVQAVFSENEPEKHPPAPEPSSEQASGDFGIPPEFDIPNASEGSEASETPMGGGNAKTMARLQAVALFSTISGFGQSIGGASCKPLDIHKAMMIESYEAFFLENPGWKMPAWAGCLIATGSYGVYCYQQQTFRARAEPWFKRAFSAIGGIVGRIRGRMAARRFTQPEG